MSARQIDNRQESLKTLKLTLRAIALTAAGALFWHAPTDVAWLVYSLRVIAALIFLYAFSALVVSATSWRNIVCRAIGVRNSRKVQIHLIGIVCLLAIGVGAMVAITIVGTLVSLPG